MGSDRVEILQDETLRGPLVVEGQDKIQRILFRVEGSYGHPRNGDDWSRIRGVG